VAAKRSGWYRPIESVVRLQGGQRLRIDTASFMEWIVFFKGDYEPSFRRILEDNLRPGQVAIDVGANVGIHTLTMSRAVGTGTVIACEPHPLMRERLLANLKVNSVENVRVESSAISAEPGEALFYIPRKDVTNQMVASLCGGSDPTLDTEPLRVTVRTLDQIVEGIPGRVGLIKIDVEGLEGGVLRGGHRLLERDKPILIFEFTAEKWAASGYSLEQVLHELSTLGYHRFQLIEDGLKPLKMPLGDYANILASA
jgi:FkbM family methyltransferase